jgi:UDP-N-acetylmuramate dehydrogenase
VNWPESLEVLSNTPLAPHTSWLIGGPADFFCEPKTVGELCDVQKVCVDKKIPISILGGGTNVLISDKGIRGMVISLARLTGIEIVSEKENLKFWAMAGTNKSELLKVFLKHKLVPAKFLAGLPGQAGGGVVMNAGIGESLVPREFCEITESIEVARPDGHIEKIDGKKLNWSYRHCHGWQPGIITRVLISWPNKPDAEVLAEVKKLNQNRLQKQPLEWPSCGSVFRNPKPEHAGALIEKAGLKGHTIGGAQISEKHANFIVNKGDAKADDVRALIEHAQKTVKKSAGVDLHTEVVFVGDF